MTSEQPDYNRKRGMGQWVLPRTGPGQTRLAVAGSAHNRQLFPLAAIMRANRPEILIHKGFKGIHLFAGSSVRSFGTADAWFDLLAEQFVARYVCWT
jgi:hypothetical protein